ncbi:hypothetical protein BO70DRAFT_210266 [Aspergillus heteromorphus CBS 117.55]|uniref:Uncharacterized protein n=1 Tax=Aspergillus heteromorphus CBS 117.55 TaxID=1448321 RepID=A0A317WRG5_9EURO|nr:uncharacterized protein BO70DRAFT_210266 [Aspergillus heteromorphus CBS 117.55]PWY86760.1 hypothetical protein BO70DRAFT_210266 [Aspergillus heteromorphus CBS 117.55]
MPIEVPRKSPASALPEVSSHVALSTVAHPWTGNGTHLLPGSYHCRSSPPALLSIPPSSGFSEDFRPPVVTAFLTPSTPVKMESSNPKLTICCNCIPHWELSCL